MDRYQRIIVYPIPQLKCLRKLSYMYLLFKKKNKIRVN